MEEKNGQLSETKIESFKSQLKSVDEKELATLVTGVTEQIRSGRYRKVEVQHDVITVLTQKRPRVNSVTRQAYQAFIYNVIGVASGNMEVMRKVRNFAKEYNLEY